MDESYVLLGDEEAQPALHGDEEAQAVLHGDDEAQAVLSGEEVALPCVFAGGPASAAEPRREHIRFCMVKRLRRLTLSKAACP